MKVLAVNEALSLQVHPEHRAGPGRLRAAGREDPTPDSWSRSSPCPASTASPASAMSRAQRRSSACCRSRGRTRPPTASWPARLRRPCADLPPKVLALSGPELLTLIRGLGEAARQADAAVDAEAARVFGMLEDLAGRYPHYPGVLVTPLLNYVVAPGESMYVDAGVIHAYGSGFALKIMASSEQRCPRRSDRQAQGRRRANRHHRLHAARSAGDGRGRGVRAHRRPGPPSARCRSRARASYRCSRARSSWPPGPTG